MKEAVRYMQDNFDIKSIMKARDIISNINNWCQGSFATDVNGKYVTSTQDNNANRFCAVGALWRSRKDLPYPKLVPKVELEKLEEAARKLFGNSIYWVNDYLGHEEVLACYNYTINNNG